MNDALRSARFGPFEVDLELGQLRHRGQPVAIQELPLRLLALLLERPGQLVRRAELEARLWPEGVFVDFEHGLNTAVKKLRRALGDSPARPRYLETVPRRGYRFVGRLTEGDAPSPGDPPAEAAALLGRLPFVGRGDELAYLGARAAAARLGHGACVVVTGEAGIGKTRLLEEHAEGARAQGMGVLWGRCLEDAGAPPYAALAEALGEYARETDSDALRAVLGPHAPALAALVPALRERLAPESAPLEAEPEESRGLAAEVFLRAIRAVAESGPTLLVLEDLQWAGATALALLPRIAALAPGTKLLVVASVRTGGADAEAVGEVLARLPLGPRCGTLALGALARDRVGELVERMAGHALEDPLVDLVHRGTGGNPLLLQQVLLHLVETGQLGRARGSAAAGVDLARLDLPPTVRDVVSRRLARLGEDTRALLVAASVSPSGFHFEAAWRAAGLAEEAALDALDEACEAQLVREADRPERYEFCHALVREVVYRSLTSSRRTRVHRRYAEGLARFAAGGAPPHAEIAEHYWQSAALRGAEAGLGHCLAAADAAELAASYADSARFLRMGLALVPPGEEPRVEARLGLALAWSGDREGASRVAAHAGELLAASEGPAAAAAYLADAADAVWWALFDASAWSLAEQGLPHAARGGLVWARLMAHALSGREARDPRHPGVMIDSPARRELAEAVLAHPEAVSLAEQGGLWRHLAFESREDVLRRAPGLGHILGLWAGEYREAVSYTRAAVEVALARRQHLRAALLLSLIARLEAALGELPAAEASLAGARELGRAGESPPILMLMLGGAQSEIALVRGDGFEDLLERQRQVLSLDVPEIRWALPALRAAAALTHAMAGLADEAAELLAGARAAIELAAPYTAMYPLLVHLAVEALWVAERPVGLDLLERCLREKVLAPDFRNPNADARLSLARLCALAGRFDEAEGWFARAREVLDSQGARPLRAVCDLDEARALLRRGGAGARERAGALLDSAAARFEALGMTGWLPRAEALRRGG